MKSSIENMFEDDFEVKDLDGYLKLLESLDINTDELKDILSSDGRTLLVATAGAGKSSALSYIYAKDKLFGLLTDENRKKNKGKLALITTFLKSGSQDLERQVRKTLGDLGLFDITTSGTSFKNLHSECYELLTIAGLNLKDKSRSDYVSVLSDYDADKSGLETRIFRRLFRKWNLGKVPEYPTAIEINILKSIISRKRNTIFSEFTFGSQEKDAEDIGLSLRVLDRVLEDYQSLKDSNSVIDNDDMIVNVYNYFANPETRVSRLYDLFVNRYYYLMVDEVQDMSELQYGLLKPLVESCQRVVFVGDPDQSIYSFRGASPKVLTDFERDFSPNVLPLSVSYRCPSNILNPVAKSIRLNSNRFDTKIRSFRDGGFVQATSYIDLVSMTKQAVKIIDESLSKGKTVAVISRTNFSYSPSMIGWVLSKKTPFNLLGDAYTLDKSKYKRVWSLVEMVRGRGLSNLKQNLRVLDPEFPAWSAKEVESILSNNIPKDGNVIMSFSWLAQNYRSRVFGAISEKLKEMDLSLDSARLSVFKMLLTSVKFYGKRTDAEVVDTILTIADYASSIEEFLQFIDLVNLSIKGSTSNKKAVSPLTFSTVHGFKGKQADVVIGFNISKGIFPSELSKESEFEEERRNFFILGTRASKEMYYLTLTDNVSPFLEEIGLPIERVAVVSEASSLKSNSELLKERLSEKANPSDDLDDLDLDDFEF